MMRKDGGEQKKCTGHERRKYSNKTVTYTRWARVAGMWQT